MPTRRRRLVLTRARTLSRKRVHRLGVGGPGVLARGGRGVAACNLRAATLDVRAVDFHVCAGSPRAKRARTRCPCTAGREEQRAKRPRELREPVNPHLWHTQACERGSWLMTWVGWMARVPCQTTVSTTGMPRGGGRQGPARDQAPHAFTVAAWKQRLHRSMDLPGRRRWCPWCRMRWATERRCRVDGGTRGRASGLSPRAAPESIVACTMRF